MFDYVIDANQSTQYVQNKLDKIVENLKTKDNKQIKLLTNGLKKMVYSTNICEEFEE